jgi:transposase
LFAAFNILNGKVIGSCLPRHRGKEFIKFLNQLEKEVPPDLDIHLILDNYSTHKSAAVRNWLKPKRRRRFHFHFTPTSSSWLNQVERWFGLITDKMIRRGTFHSVEELERAIYSWLATWNDMPKAFVWKASADVILDKVRRCKELAGTAHWMCGLPCGIGLERRQLLLAGNVLFNRPPDCCLLLFFAHAAIFSCSRFSSKPIIS